MKYLKIIAYLIIVFVISEGLFRVINPLGIGYFNRAYKYLRSCQETGLGYYLNASFESNARGLRGYNNYSHKEKKRILLIGDSIVYGLGVSLEKTFTCQLQGMLPDYEVVNAGVGGWNTQNEYLWLKHEGINLDPDIVILYITNNDVENVYAGKVPQYPTWQKVCYNSYVLSSVFYIKRNLFKMLYGRTSLGENTTADGFDIARNALNGMIDLLGKRLVVCMYGSKVVQDAPIMQFYLGILKERKVPCFFLAEKYYNPKYRISKIDHHPNELGHRFIANTTNAIIKELYE